MTQKHPGKIQPNAALHRRLTACFALVAAGACAVATAPRADAAVVYSRPFSDSVVATATSSHFNTTTFAFGTDTAVSGVNLWGASNSDALFYPTGSTSTLSESNASSQPFELAALAPVGPAVTATPITILGAADAPKGAGIIVAAAPEPGTLGALAVGALGAGALAWRRRTAA